MKMVLCSLVLLSSFAAFAGQENRGATLCQSAEVRCSNEDGSIYTCIRGSYEGGTAYSGDLKGEGADDSSEVKRIPPPAHSVGAPVVYKGRGFQLVIKTDTLENDDGILSYFSDSALKLKNEELRCQFKK